MDRVVIVGGGFAGLAAARRLAGAPVDVQLVDRHNFHSFQPLLYQVATVGLDAAEHALCLYTLDDARWVRNTVLASLERADREHADSDPLVVVVGGGPTGVETTGALTELIDIAIRHDRLRLDRRPGRVVLLDARDRLLPGFAPRASAYAEKTLRARGVEVRLGTQVASVSRAGVTLADGSKIAAAVVIWVAGVKVEGTLASGLAGLRGQNGRRVVEPDLSLAFYPEVFVVGDAAALRSPGGGTEIEGGRSPSPDGPLVPQVAQATIQSGDHAARQILNRVSGKETTRFVYHDKGMMATVGRRAAIAQLRGGAVVRGMPGWLAWLSLHLVYLIGFRNRVVVLVNWAWRYCKWPAGLRLIVGDVEHRLGGPALRCPECRRSAPQRP